MKRQPNVLTILLIIGAILLGIGMFIGVGWAVLSSFKQPVKPSREAVLAKFMPEQPKATRFIKGGYDPKTRCFDKCGYLYRQYGYADQSTICKNLFAVLAAEGDHFTITSPSTKQPPTKAWCEDKVKQPQSFILNMDTSVILKTGIHEKARTVVSVIVNPGQKTIEYRVSEINEGITITR